MPGQSTTGNQRRTRLVLPIHWHIKASHKNRGGARHWLYTLAVFFGVGLIRIPPGGVSEDDDAITNPTLNLSEEQKQNE